MSLHSATRDQDRHLEGQIALRSNWSRQCLTPESLKVQESWIGREP